MEPNAADFETLMRNSAGRLLAVARRILRNDSDAEDALQEAIISGWRARQKFDGRSSMDTWMHRIVVNTALNRLKQRAAREAHLDERTDGVFALAGTNHTDSLAMREVVWNAINRLPDDQRVVLILRDVEEFTTEQIAEQLEISPAAVRQRLHRARKHAAEELYPELCGAGDMTCGGRLDLLLDMIDGVLAEDVRRPVLDHVASCATCTRYAAGYRETINLPLRTAEPSAEVSQLLLARLSALA